MFSREMRDWQGAGDSPSRDDAAYVGYAVLGVCCTRWMRYSLYAVLGVCLYSVNAVLRVNS